MFKLEDNEIVRRAVAFKRFVDNVNFSQYQPFEAIAMDETAVYLGQGNTTTVERSGVSSVYLHSTGYESARVSVVLGIYLDGKKAPPLLIAKGKKDTLERINGVDTDLRNIDISDDVIEEDDMVIFE